MFLLHGSGQVLGPNVKKLSNILHALLHQSIHLMINYFIHFIFHFHTTYMHNMQAHECKKTLRNMQTVVIFQHVPGWEFPAGV